MARISDIFRLRPKPTQWFETYIPRSQTVYALEALAATGLVELEADPRFATPLILNEIRQTVDHFNSLRSRYGDSFPPIEGITPHIADEPEQTAHEALTLLRNYCAQVASLRRRREHLRNRLNNLSLLQEYLNSVDCSSDNLAGLQHKSSFLYKQIYSCPAGAHPEPDQHKSIYLKVTGTIHDYFAVAALPDRADEIQEVFKDCQQICIPDWITVGCHEKSDLLISHIKQLKDDISEIEQAISALQQEQSPAEALSSLTTLSWFVDHAPELAEQQKLCHVAGWTVAENSSDLQEALLKSDITATIRFTSTPEGVKPPVTAFRSSWIAPFHIFIDLLGTPDKMEVDPSVLLPFIVPLLFGFMFPDIGHGLILVLVGWLFRSRPKLRILLPCGLYSIAFGFLFGSFFGSHAVFQALWFHPMDDPIKVLLICIVLGFFLLMLSIVFSGIEAYWKGKLHNWLILEVTVLVLFCAGFIGIFIPDVLLVLPLALIAYIVGIVTTYRGDRLSNILLGMGNLLESTFELILNTVSFMRIGVFALAHEGMSIAANQLAADVENVQLQILVFVIGHILVILIETLVVFIQTTRLILFEFFIRFLHAEGRAFKPLDLPTKN